MWYVNIIESELGWGQKVVEVKSFETEEEANKFVTEFNAENNKDYVPSWYMYATPPYRK